MSMLCERSAVFVGCARNCGSQLDAVLANVERMAALYGKSSFLFVENDSQDDTKSRLLRWLAARPAGVLLQLDGLAQREPSRTARLASARNAYLDALRAGPYREYDDLIVLDLDEVNASPIDLAAFASAAEFLHADARTSGVFANSSPVYYDIWALRHPVWCPGDCWADIRAIRHLPPAEVVERLLYARQIAIDRGQPPILVQSAFGGLGLYRLARVLPQRYVGTHPDGTEVCEHVSVNLALSRDGQLFIYPALQNSAPELHLRPKRLAARALELEQDGQRCSLLAPPEHGLDAARAAHPLYGRRLPWLARALAAAAPRATMIDVDAGIGDTVALCRLAGCDAPFLALECNEPYFSFLEANRQASPQLFRAVRTARSAIVDLRELGETEVALIRCGAQGRDARLLHASLPFLSESAPVIWTQAAAASPGDTARWRQLCSALASGYSDLCLFDHRGVLLEHGPLAAQQATFIDLLNYRQRAMAQDASTVEAPAIHDMELVLFPHRWSLVHQAFVAAVTAAAG